MDKLNRIKELNNDEEFQDALNLLDSLEPEYTDNPYYCVRRAIALFLLHREDESVEWFRKAQEKGLEDIDEMPDTYLPTSVAKWLERAESWAPRRVEKNKFEAERRDKRTPVHKNNNLADFDFQDFWDDCDYSLESYVGSTPSDKEIAEAEAKLGYRLPESYKALIKKHNGGMLKKDSFENPLQRDWWPDVFSVDSIYGIDPSKSYSLCGDTGSKFWIEEWGYPDIGIAIADTQSGGHDMIFLDYSDCGPDGEPCVVHIDQESDYEITWLADNFEDFVRGLTEYYDEDEEEEDYDEEDEDEDDE